MDIVNTVLRSIGIIMEYVIFKFCRTHLSCDSYIFPTLLYLKRSLIYIYIYIYSVNLYYRALLYHQLCSHILVLLYFC